MLTKPDIVAFNGLTAALNAGLVVLRVDERRFQKFGSPAYNPWEFLAPMLCAALASILVMIAAGNLWGLAAGAALLAVSAAAYRIWYVPKIGARMAERIRAQAISGAAKLDELWQYGGLKLIVAASPKIGVRAPNDWRPFVSLNFPELMSVGAPLPAAPGMPVQ